MPFLRRITKFLPNFFRRARGAADIAALETLIGHRFRNPALLQTALTHPSLKSGDSTGHDYQRLEFLGDAVLSLVLAEALYADPAADEGLLTEARTRLVCGRNLAAVGRRIGIGKVLRVARNGDAARIRESDTANEDATEALFGAVFLDGGLKSARKLAKRLFGGELRMDTARVEQGRSAKNRLQEQVQKDGRPNNGNRIEYRTVHTSGPSHARRFQIEVWVDGVLRGQGEGSTKRVASEAAAQSALEGKK
jgi:ribonuclease-3